MTVERAGQQPDLGLRCGGCGHWLQADRSYCIAESCSCECSDFDFIEMARPDTYMRDIADAVFAKLTELEYDAPGAPWHARVAAAACRNDAHGLVEALLEAAIHKHEGGKPAMNSITKAPGHAQVRCEICLVHDQDGGLRPVSYSTSERPNGRIGVCAVCELFISKGRITLTTETLTVIRHIRARHHWMVHIRHGAGVSPCSDPGCVNEWHYHAGGGNPRLNGRPWKVCTTEGCDHVYAIESEHRLKLPGDVCWDCHQRRRA